MALIAGRIGNFPFSTLDGTLTINQEMWKDISRSGEGGLLAIQEGKKGKRETLVGLIDLLTRNELYTQQIAYRTLKDNATPVSVQVRFDDGFLQFDGFFVHDFRVVEWWHSPTVSGGVNAGQFFLRTEWILQYSLQD